MRVLEFVLANDVERYEVIHEGLLMSETPLKGIQARLSAKLFDKLEKIGVPREALNGNVRFTLVRDGNVALEEPEYSLLLICLNNVSWNALGARRFVRVLDYLESLKDADVTLKLEE